MSSARQKEREWLLFMTGVIVGAMLGVLADLVALPWWLNLPLFLAGLWVVVDTGRGWMRERERQRALREEEEDRWW